MKLNPNALVFWLSTFCIAYAVTGDTRTSVGAMGGAFALSLSISLTGR